MKRDFLHVLVTGASSAERSTAGLLVQKVLKKAGFEVETTDDTDDIKAIELTEEQVRSAAGQVKINLMVISQGELNRRSQEIVSQARGQASIDDFPDWLSEQTSLPRRIEDEDESFQAELKVSVGDRTTTVGLTKSEIWGLITERQRKAQAAADREALKAQIRKDVLAEFRCQEVKLGKEDV